MTGPSRREVERALSRLEDRDGSPLGGSPPGQRDTKLLVGVRLSAFSLPDSAVEEVTEYPLAYEDAESVEKDADALGLSKDAQTVGFDPDALLDAARDAEGE